MLLLRNVSKIIKKLIMGIVSLVLFVSLFGCANDAFTIPKKNMDLKVGQSETVEVDPSDLFEKLEWSSDKPGVATVKSGVITGIGEGEAIITVKSGKKEQKIKVIVSCITVTFETNGGSEIEPKTLSYGEKLERPAAPTKDGANFLNWYSDADLAVIFDFDQEITDNLTLYGKWDDIKYDIEFTVEGEPYHNAAAKIGEKVVKPDDPVKTGYDFIDWFFLYDDKYEVKYDFNLPVEGNLTIYAKFQPRNDIPYVVKHLVYNQTTGEFDLKDTDNLVGTADKEITIELKAYNGLIPEYDEYKVVIAGDGSLVVTVKYIEIDFSFTYELNGGNFTYKDKAELVADFLKDYNTFGGTTYTKENLPLGPWVLNNFHTFLYNENYYAKWKWLPAYLAKVGSNTNKKACADFATVTTADAFNAINSNHIYALSYEIRGFILDIKYTNNASWMSSDYSEYNLGHGFWGTFVSYNEQTQFKDQKEPFTLTQNVYKEGYNFVGWYLNEDLSGNRVTGITRSGTVYAKWDEKNPVTGILILNPISTILKYDTYQLTISILPDTAFNKNVQYTTSNDKILKISDTGLMTAENAGTVTVTVKSVVRDVKATLEITVLGGDDVDVEFSEGYDGCLYLNDEATIKLKGVGNINPTALSFVANNPDILTINENGLIKGIKAGEATVDIVLTSTAEVLLTLVIPVYPAPDAKRIDQLLDLLKGANQPVVERLNASLLYDSSSKQQCFKSTYGSVNLYLFDGLNLDDKNYLINTQTMTNKHSGLMPAVEFITIHDTANISGGLTAHGNYWLNTAHTTSIHFTVGDFGIIQSLDTSYAGHHAGDGTSVQFNWEDTQVNAGGNLNPEIDVSADGYFTFNGVKTPILAPKKDGQILDKSYFTHLGPNWKIGENGNYYLGTTWLDRKS
ncbi:MAG: InlB B-repeat-containing protein, partial [Bacilli bacterium]|nr:InlB B-repeat-containing protein [Bacilli bacterium]